MLPDPPSPVVIRVRKRRQRRRTLVRQRLFAVSVCGTASLIAGLIVLMVLHLHQERTERTSIVATDGLPPGVASGDPTVNEASAAISSNRPVYRYSVIPGGAYTATELSDAIHADAVVAAHYTDVSVRNIRIRRVTDPRRVYMSYRLRDRIYWTSKPIALKVGELILDDGVNQIRARCGNRIATDLPPAVTVAKDEPEPTELDDVQPILPSRHVSAPGPRLVEGGAPSAPEFGGDTPNMAVRRPLGFATPGIGGLVPMSPRDTQPDDVSDPAGTKAPVDVAATPSGGGTPSGGPDSNTSPQHPNDHPKQDHPNTPSNPHNPDDSGGPIEPGLRVDPTGPVLPNDPHTPIRVPEPATILMAGAGLLATAAGRFWSRRR